MNALEVREARFCSVADSLLTPQERKQKMDYLYDGLPLLCPGFCADV